MAWLIGPSGREDMGSVIALSLWQAAICKHSGKDGIRITFANESRMCDHVNRTVFGKCMMCINPFINRSVSKWRSPVGENVHELAPMTNV